MPRVPLGPDLRHAAPGATQRGTLRMVAAALGKLRGWLFAERRYRPERREFSATPGR